MSGKCLVVDTVMKWELHTEDHILALPPPPHCSSRPAVEEWLLILDPRTESRCLLRQAVGGTLELLSSRVLLVAYQGTSRSVEDLCIAM